MSTEFTVQTSIAIAPWTSQGIFYQGDPVTISNSLGTTIEVYDFHGNSITTAPPPVTLTTLPMGHYFVQVDGINGGFGDRAQFSIWPKGYTNYLHSDIGLEPTNLWCTTYEIARFLRMVPGFSREQTRWEDVYSNGVYNWTSYWDVLAQGKTAPIKVMNLITYHSGSVTSNLSAPLEETTNSMSNWVNDVAVLWSNAAARYGTNFVYEILNEPSWVSITFPTNQYIVPPAPNSLEVYPSGMAVSAAVQAIRFVCPNCQTWAPVIFGGGVGFYMQDVTDVFVRPYYTNVTMLSAHGPFSPYGPVDADCAYTNRTDLGQWMANDVGDKYINNIYGKQVGITEAYAVSPDVLGKTNSWWITTNSTAGWCPTCVPNWSWNWYTMTMRWWKNLLLWEATGTSKIEMYEVQLNAMYSPVYWATNSYWGDPSSYVGWEGVYTNDRTGCGPRPSVDGQAMISWWLTGATPITSWLSGSPITVVDPLGGYTRGPPGLHFWTWQFANRTTNTFIWADEALASGVTTNIGAGLTDIFSNQWNGPIGIEPVIAWGWPNNSLGGSFSIVPVAAFSASPTYGRAPTTVTFTDGSAGAITSRSWQFGDGFVTNTPELTVVHRYRTPGSNTVQLIVSGPGGTSTNAQSNMVIVAPVSPPLNGGGSNGVPPVTGGTPVAPTMFRRGIVGPTAIGDC